MRNLDDVCTELSASSFRQRFRLAAGDRAALPSIEYSIAHPAGESSAPRQTIGIGGATHRDR